MSDEIENEEVLSLPDCEVVEMNIPNLVGAPTTKVCKDTPQPKNIIDGIAYARVELHEAGPTAEVIVPEEEEEGTEGDGDDNEPEGDNEGTEGESTEGEGGEGGEGDDPVEPVEP